MLRRLERYSIRLFLGLLKFVIGSRTPIDLAVRPFGNVLVIRQHDQLGDMLCAVPLLRGLRERYREARIVLMTSPVNHEVMLHSPYVDEIIKYDKREFLGSFFIKPAKVLKYIGRLRKGGFELVVVPSTVSASVTSDLLSYLSGATCRVGAESFDGTRSPSGVFFNCPVRLDWKGDPHRHQALRNLDIASMLHLDVTDLSSKIKVTEEEVDCARDFLSAAGMTGPLVAYHPGAGKPPNRWPADRFAYVAVALANEFRMGTVITHGPMDDEPVRVMKSRLVSPFLVVEKKTIREVAAVLSLVRLVISNDTGIMHVAAAVGTPVLSLFGPTDPHQWAPIGAKNRFIEGKGEDIRSISVEEVLALAREMLTML